MMIDFVTVEIPDPTGRRVNDGAVVRFKADGSVDWETPCRKTLEGSWGSSITARALGAEFVEAKLNEGLGHHHSFKRQKSGLVLSGNPAKFLNGHNLYGSDCLQDLLWETLNRCGSALWQEGAQIEYLDMLDGDLSRIDLTGSWLVERPGDVLPFLRALEAQAYVPWRGRGAMDDLGTLYYGKVQKGKRSKAWALKLYDKGREIGVHKLPEPAYHVPGLLDEVNRTIRVELTLRSAELKRLGMTKVSDWTPQRVREIWETYVNKLDLGDAREIDRSLADLLALPGVKTRHVTAIAAWKAGEDMRSLYKKSALYQTRREVKDLTGLDLFTAVPKSNVIQLRRVIEARPAARPEWADALEQALAA